ncbi:hypothetical protein FRC12_010789 [Ceratobasidium sp. 428]|nr:hypothetical protein FRC12_010789 [Ceratobasidium sp. 428]
MLTVLRISQVPGFILGRPVRRQFQASAQTQRQICKYFGLAEAPPAGMERWTTEALRERIDWGTLIRYGRFRLASMGDRVRVANLISKDPTVARDNSFVRYMALPDKNAAHYNLPDQPIRQVYYACVLDVFYVEFIRNRAVNGRKKYLLARVQDCKTPPGLDATRPENPVVEYNQLSSPEIINLGTVDAAIGRIKVGGRNTWAIVDRSRGARTVFNDEDGNPDPDLN